MLANRRTPPVSKSEYDLILWGATGFTGRLVAEHLLTHYGTEGELKWAIAGRSQEKLDAVRRRLLDIDCPESLPILLADAGDADSLAALVSSTRVLATTVGPYARYGSKLVAACAQAGTDYCDLSGEAPWMARMIALHQTTAESSGARIVHTCGFDSIPSDLGTWFLQQNMLYQFGQAAARVKGRVRRFKGGASGGTIASMLTMLEQARSDANIRKALRDPYLLYPAGTAPGPKIRDQIGARYDADFKQWTSPFIMAAVNTRVVRRSNALLGFPWGENFRYDEAQLAGSRLRASRNAMASGAGVLTLSMGPGRRIAQRLLPKPGEGPNREQREAGHYELLFHGNLPDDASKALRVRFAGRQDPGYGSTSRMFAEAAACLAQDELPVSGGFWTPASALGMQLIERLRQRADISLEMVEADEYLAP
jgi:short subunit dehydrogenase-like uncharacterized protein